MCTKQYAPSMRSLIVVSYLSTLAAAQFGDSFLGQSSGCRQCSTSIAGDGIEATDVVLKSGDDGCHRVVLSCRNMTNATITAQLIDGGNADLAQGTAAEKMLKCQNGRWTGREMITRRELTITRAFCKRYELDEHGCVGSASQSGRSQAQGDATYCSPGDTECERKKKQSQCDVMFAPTFIYMKDMKLGDAKDLEDIVKLANDNNQISKIDMGQFGSILGTLLPNVHSSSTSSTSNTQPTLPPLPPLNTNRPPRF